MQCLFSSQRCSFRNIFKGIGQQLDLILLALVEIMIDGISFTIQRLPAIPQLHPLGCAVACVASRCGISYWTATVLFSHPDYAWTRGFYCSDIVEALSTAGWIYSYAEFDPVLHRDLVTKNGTIVFIEPCSRYPAGHYFIRTEKEWMNPWSNFPLMNEVQAQYQTALPAPISYIIYEMGAF